MCVNPDDVSVGDQQKFHAFLHDLDEDGPLRVLMGLIYNVLASGHQMCLGMEGGPSEAEAEPPPAPGIYPPGSFN